MRYFTILLILSVAISADSRVGHGQPAVAAQTRAVLAASGARISVRADSRLWLEGSSNVRDWTCKATTMDASIEINSDGSGRQPLEARAVRGVVVRVPVRSLKCGDRHMEAEMYRALKAPKPPAESFIMANFDKLPDTGAGLRTVDVTGRLMIAGVERTVKMSVLSDRLSDGTHRARGTVPILMTDFGIKPPRPWRGILKTRDKVLIQFEIFISPLT